MSNSTAIVTGGYMFSQKDLDKYTCSVLTGLTKGLVADINKLYSEKASEISNLVPKLNVFSKIFLSKNFIDKRAKRIRKAEERKLRKECDTDVVEFTSSFLENALKEMSLISNFDAFGREYVMTYFSEDFVRKNGPYQAFMYLQGIGVMRECGLNENCIPPRLFIRCCNIWRRVYPESGCYKHVITS